MKMNHLWTSGKETKGSQLKRYSMLLFVICLLMTIIPLSSSFADTRIKDVNEMWDFLDKKGILGEMSMGSQKYLDKLKGLLSSDLTALGSRAYRTGQNDECSGFAEAIMQPMFGKGKLKDRTTQTIMRGIGYIDYKELQKYGVPQRGITLIRTAPDPKAMKPGMTEKEKKKYKDFNDPDHDWYGHSIIVLYYDEDNIYTVEGNQTGSDGKKGYNVFFRRSYPEFNRNQLISTTGEGIRAGDPRIIKYVVTVSDEEFIKRYDDVTGLLKINNTNFPDANFREYIKSFDQDHNGFLSETEISSVKKIQYDSGKEKKKDISNLKGIEFFTELTELEIKQCSVEKVDLSKNLKLESVTLACKLKALDVSKNTQLKTLRCDENNISKLTLGKQDQLNVLLVVNNHDKLRKINIKHCKELCSIAKKYEPVVGPKYTLWGDPSSNTNRILLDNGMKLISKSDGGDEDTEIVAEINEKHFPDANFRKIVKKFDKNKDGKLSKAEIASVKKMEAHNGSVDHSIMIKDMKGIEYFTELTELNLYAHDFDEIDLSKNTKLTYLRIASRTKKLDVSKNTKLEMLICDECLELTKVILGKQDHLAVLNLVVKSDLKEVDISGCKLLCELVKKNKREKGITFDSWGDVGVDKIYMMVKPGMKVITGAGDSGEETGKTVAINKKNFPDADFRKYIKRFDTNEDGKFSKEELLSVKDIYIYGEEADHIETLKGIEYFTELTALAITHAYKLKEADISKNVNLVYLQFERSDFKKLNVSKNNKLKSLICYTCGLTELILGKQDHLTYLRAEGNLLKKLDISKCKMLLKLVKETESVESRYMGDYVSKYWGHIDDQYCLGILPDVKLITK